MGLSGLVSAGRSVRVGQCRLVSAGWSVIVDDFNIERVVVYPAKTNSPLLVDSNTPLSFAIASQGFEVIRGRNSKVVERDRPMQHSEFSHRNGLNIARQAARTLEPKHPLRLLARESPDHPFEFIVSRYRINRMSFSPPFAPRV